MCGIVAAVARRDVVPVLLEGLRRLEYRGYDSAGIAVVNGRLRRLRSAGRVAELAALARQRGRLGAPKLKEITYIHAEAHAAGELKHGPLALIDARMPVVALAPHDALLEKLQSNLQEVRARGGELYVLAAADARLGDTEAMHVARTPAVDALVSPIVQAVPLQLLAYHAALARGTDVDKPRNLAKSVTVE